LPAQPPAVTSAVSLTFGSIGVAWERREACFFPDGSTAVAGVPAGLAGDTAFLGGTTADADFLAGFAEDDAFPELFEPARARFVPGAFGLDGATLRPSLRIPGGAAWPSSRPPEFADVADADGQALAVEPVE
jgi:hypothetical protein